MPKITINEIDLTTGGSLNATSNIVYVPGLAQKLPSDFDINDKPRLYQDLSSFQADFGDKVPRISLGNSASALTAPGFGDGLAYDTGYIYATELLRLGMPVLYDCLCSINLSGYAYKLPGSDSIITGKTKQSIPSTAIIQYITPLDTGNAFSYNSKNSTDGIVDRIAAAVNKSYLKDKGLYNIKFISNGGYIDNKINIAIEALAVARGDCCAIQDISYAKTYDNIKDAINNNKLSDIGLSVTSTPTGKYTAAFTPWGSYKVPCIQNYIKKDSVGTNKAEYYPSEVELPASFAYLMAAANCFATGVNNWSAVAGASRGTIPYLKSLKERYTEEQINNVLQTRDRVSINPIATINPFGDIIWGNRTLFNNVVNGNLTASSFLNIRNLISDVKKTVFKAARQLTFEQNSAILWVKFKSLVKPTLDQMVTGAGLSGYELIKNVTKEKAKLVATVRLFAIEAVEDFDITIELADDTAAITE